MVQGKMPKVHVKISGILTRPKGKAQLDVDLKPKTTVRRLLLILGYDKKHVNRILVVVNGTLRKQDHVLEDGDVVSLSIIIGGG